MSEERFRVAVARMDPDQWEAVRVCIMAERRLRSLYPRTPEAGPVMQEAYIWALNAKPEPLPALVAQTQK